MKHTLVALLQDQPGVLNRAISLFRRRIFNIESLSVGQSETPGIARMTLVVDGDRTSVEQVMKQLDKLIEVITVSDLTTDANVSRELILIKVGASATQRSELVQLASVFSAKIVDVANDSVIVEMSGSPDKMDSFIELLRPFGIREMVRTGRVALTRGVNN